jgi:hypothetical protein
MTPDYKALREAAEISKTQPWPCDWYSQSSAGLCGLHHSDKLFVSLCSPTTILSLLDALAASEAKAATARNDALEKAAKVSKLHIHEDCECPVCNAAKVTAARILALKDIT